MRGLEFHSQVDIGELQVIGQPRISRIGDLDDVHHAVILSCRRLPPQRP